MSNNSECADFFKSRPQYGRCLLALRRKWESYGRAAGRITLTNAPDAECRAIGGIVGRIYDEGTIRFSVAEFEAGLQRTRFAPVELGGVLACYFGEEISTNQEQKRRVQEGKAEFFAGLIDFFEGKEDEVCEAGSDGACGFAERDLTESFGLAERISGPKRVPAGGEGRESAAARWLRFAAETKKYGYQLLAKEYARDAGSAGELARTVGRALNALAAGDGQMLAVFAAKISGNPHCFDRGTPAGELLMHALCFYQSRELPKSAHAWRELMRDAGIVPDTVSSSVHALGLRLRTEDGYHPAYEAFCARREPCVITLENLRDVIGAGTVGSCVYVVENEMVFSYLAECVGEKAVTLLCTSGQPRTAALELFSLLAAAHVRIYYSGDIDPEGIVIADRLWQQYGDSVQIWRMGPTDYEKSISAERVDVSRMAKLKHIRHPALLETAERVRERGCAGYQENLLGELAGDVRSGVSG